MTLTAKERTTAPAPAGPAPDLVRGTPYWAVLLPALAAAGLLWLSYFPVACGWLGWVALVPLLSLVRSEARPPRIYLAAWASGLAFYWPALQWMRVADPRMYATWAMLATYCSLYVPVAIWLLRRLDRRTRWPMTLTVPLVWTALEFARAHLLTGFAWYFLGHSQHDLLPVIQIADLVGAYGVTFVVAAVNGLIFELLFTRSWFRRLLHLPGEGRSSLAWQGVVVLFLVGATVAYGYVRLGQAAFATGPRVALIQGNLAQGVRNEVSSGQAGEDIVAIMVRHYAHLSDEAARQQPDLIVWPETSCVEEWIESPPGQPTRDSQELADTLARRWKTSILLGLNSQVREPGRQLRRYNSALLIRPDGQANGRYDKIHRVPFGEYVPLRDWFPWMNTFAPYDFDYSIQPGEGLTQFSLGAWHFGVLICYEDTDPNLARQYVVPGGEKADFLLNISNDGWFDGTSEHEEHLAICRFRAVEARRSVARAVNMGVSAVVDGDGRVVALPGPDWGRSKKTASVLTATVPIDHRASLYAAWGDWLPWGCWLGVAAGLLRRIRPVQIASA
jgi:apolipoprotein N-acyltransferase